MQKPEGVGVRLAQLRSERGLSQNDLAKISGISKNSQSLIETGAASPTISTLWRLAQGLGCTLRDLLEIEEPKAD